MGTWGGVEYRKYIFLNYLYEHLCLLRASFNIDGYFLEHR